MRYFFTLLFCSALLFSCKSEKEEKVAEIEETSEVRQTGRDQEEASEEQDLPEIQPISHATAVINWDDITIYLDPVGGAEAFEGMDEADLVLITDIHGDHMDAKTLNALNLGDTKIIVPQAVKKELPDSLAPNLVVMNNGDTLDQQGISIEAIPMYNLREEAKQFHPKGRGNGYVLEKNGKSLYIAGDTEDIPEMRNLENIDIALVPMNLPYTMTVESAADGVLEFAPKQVYPYHFRGKDGKSDIQKFKRLVNEGNKDIEVVMANWYPEEPQQ
ncbi:MBL fold metallo-hydrolase [Salinimicrobium catena]|uniref:MBL fold metallo-hydrolase n=1 Tax=Salinimicrobium catena TaxID=390640 RepID=UPI002FE45B0B